MLGVLNSSTAGFWLKQVCFPRRLDGESWETYFEFSGTKIEDYPLPTVFPVSAVRELELFIRTMEQNAPSRLIGEAKLDLEQSKLRWSDARRMLISINEELDWRTYVAYGLVDAELAPDLPETVPIEPNERVFEIRLAREVAAGESSSSWFVRHDREAVAELPTSWPSWYRELASRRLAAIETNPSLRILEQPEYKRRWAGASWRQLVAEAVSMELLKFLEDFALWRDASGRPVIRSAAQIGDQLRHAVRFRELLVVYVGSQDYDLATEVGKLLNKEAVPAFASLRYKSAGIEKFRAWQRTWELQRAEDRGAQVEVPVPPKFVSTDFQKQTYWSARGKLDVPKERFLSFPGSRLPDDSTELYGWAGWDHAERGQAIARLANDVARAGAPEEQIIPLVGALIELQPWLNQWHSDIDARSGVSPASAISGVTTALLGRLGIGADTVRAWRPAPATRGRKKA